MMREKNPYTIFNNIYDAIKSNKYVFILLCLAIFSLTLMQNIAYPNLADDWEYTFIFKQFPPERISSLSDIIKSQYNHYLFWGELSVVHFIAQLLLMQNPFIQDLFNSLAYILFIFIIYKIANKNNKTNTFLLLIISLFLWFLLPAFVNTTLWITGSANYLWGTLIIILFIYPYYSYYINKKKNYNLIQTLFFLPFGIVAGWTNENMAFAMIFFIISLLILIKKEKEKISTWMIIGLTGAIIGFSVMVLAPGNQIRSEHFINSDNSTLFDLMIIRLKSVLKRQLIIPILISIITIFAYRKYNKNTNKEKTLKISILFLSTAIIGLLAMLGSPFFPTRALFGIISFIIISICILLANLNPINIKLKIINITFLISLITVFIFNYSKKYEITHRISVIMKQRELYIFNQKAKGITNITFTEKNEFDQKYGFSELSEDPNYWINELYAKYYELDSVRLITNE